MSRSFLISLSVISVLIFSVFAVWPELDLIVSGLFYRTGSGFFLRENVILNGLTKIAFYGARALFFIFVVSSLICLRRRRPLIGLPTKAWAFLALCLLIGPGLVANVVFKDNWGRARPRDVVQFEGSKPFTPAAVISDACVRNCSFVSGDASFGFFLPSIAYVVPLRRSRRVFWSAMGVGSVFAVARILLGAHFLSDVLYAFLLVFASSAVIHCILYGKEKTSQRWNEWLSNQTSRH